MSALTQPLTRFQAAAAQEFTSTQRIFIGGLGALTPIILNSLIVDLPKTFQALHPSVVVGWSLRAMILFYLGGLYSWLHKKERETVRLFELGIVAPAMFMAMVNGANAEKHGSTSAHTLNESALSAEPATIVWRVSSRPQQEPVFRFAQPPRESIAQGLLRGFMGGSGQGSWFVYDKQSYASPQEASARVRELDQRGIPARVYEPGGPVAGFVVVVGDWLTEHAARSLQAELSKRNLTTSVWERTASEPVTPSRVVLLDLRDL